MATEIELKLALTPATARALERHPLLAGITPTRHRLLNTYYDTPDLSLKAQRVALRFRKRGRQWLLTVKSAEPASGGLAQRNEWETPAIPGQWQFDHVDQAALRNMLHAAVPALEAIFTTNFRRIAWTLEVGTSVVELALDRGHIESQGRRKPICEVELELISGEVADLFVLTRQLQADLILRPSVASKAERGYALFSGTPLQPYKARPILLSPDQTPLQAFRQIALDCLEQLQRNEEGIIHSDDPEFVHQARVALRRLRSAIKVFAPVLPEDFSQAWISAWKAVASPLGEARDWDVFLGETLPPVIQAFPGQRPIQHLAIKGRRHAKVARRIAEKLLSGAEYPRLMTEFSASLYSLPRVVGGAESIEIFCAEQLQTRARLSRRIARKHTKLTSDERHHLRITLKNLRYTLEFFASMLPKQNSKPYFAALTQLQQELGLINDYVTAERLINTAFGPDRNYPIQAWIAGRHSFLLAKLSDSLKMWFAQQVPWQSS